MQLVAHSFDSFMPKQLSPQDLSNYLRPGVSVYWPGCAGQSPLFEQWLLEQPEVAAGVSFCGAWIPGVNRFDPSALHPQAKATSFFLSPEFHASWKRGALDYLPLHYSEIARYLSQPGRFDIVMLHLASPDDRGHCSLSLAADFTPSVMQAIHSDAIVLAHMNPMLPRTRGPFVPVSRINAWAQAALPPLSIAPGTGNPALSAVAKQVAQLVSDGDTLQFGLGRLQAEVMGALTSHRHLKVHSGMVSDALLGLIESGSLLLSSVHSPPVCTGMAIGSAALYQAVSDPCLVQFSPVSHTHDYATLAGLPHLKAINSALEIDLLGQVNCATLKGRQVSGIGGLVDLTRGARASQGGMGIVAATALAGRAQQSRIVPMLDPSAVSMSRSDVDTVVTEHGAAHLRHLGLDDRALALIAIAAPEHREHLHQAWRTLRRNL